MPAAPDARRGMSEFRPGSRAGCGSRTKAGRRGRSWDGELVAFAGAPAPGELTESATFSATFAKGKIKILQVVAQLQVFPQVPRTEGKGHRHLPGTGGDRQLC